MRDDAAAVLMPGFVGTVLPGWVRDRLRAGLGGVCLFGDNVRDTDQVAQLTAEIRAANPAAVVSIDEEGGDVTRLHYATGSPFPGNAVLGRIDDEAATERVARAVGAQLAAVGINLDLAPDVDINSNPDNPVIGVRSFGAAPGLVARHAAAWVRGLQSTGVAACLKHFPGHGDTSADSHLALPVVDAPVEVLRERELAPFRAAIAAGARTVMTSHILLPQLDADEPATFSRRILEGLLRDELGFDGVIVTDALDMVGASGEHGIPEAAVRALVAGADLLCIGTDNSDEELASIEDAIVDAVADGRLPAERLARAATRVRELGAAPVPPADGADDVPFDTAPTRGAFDGELPALHPDRLLVQLETTRNIAIGVAPWGPAAVGAPVRHVAEGEPLPEADQLVLIGKDNHRHAWVRELIDRARTERPGTVVVDMGWPAPDRRYSDLATFGASRHVAEALVQALDGSVR
ncbi:glycoside hydrolase family 3 protein [Diaminobutyricimonas aerilata]|uniref:glycoside hydrolase family 3 protein n=1 Tax=Diaminobutyricimonas aerilata TaxID=1162967 RepID=UPI001FEA7E99|nr:glycoside hydrolase family 3 protein [Diaminobutyricimonas aerilata]